MKAFFDTNVLVYSASADPKKQKALACLEHPGIVSVQVLNEFAHVARRKLRHGWPLIEHALALFRASFDEVRALTTDTHVSAVIIARDHGIAFYDALILASAMEADCDTLFSEDFQDGHRFGPLVIVNPFTKAS